MHRRVFFSFVGAALFFVLDSLHVHAGIWRAHAAHGVPWWYFFIYAGGIFVAASLLAPVEQRLGVPRSRARLGIDIGAFVVLLAAHLWFFDYEVLLALFSLGFLIAR